MQWAKKRGEVLRGGGDSRREDIARDILNYLLQHPAAADTFDGIAHWRVLDEIARRSLASTEDAMQWLIAKDFLIEEEIPGRHSIYRLNPGKRSDAESLVKKNELKPPGRFRRSGKR